jgi:hypothetical protein
MNRFWDLLEGAGRPPAPAAPGLGSTMGAWYCNRALSGRGTGLPIRRFCEAVRAEVSRMSAGAQRAASSHPMFHEADIFRQENRP